MKSSLSLSSCIALVEKKHIPFRNSKLTDAQDSLGGQYLTAMIATVTPSSLSLRRRPTRCTGQARQIKLPGARPST